MRRSSSATQKVTQPESELIGIQARLAGPESVKRSMRVSAKLALLGFGIHERWR
jgi:hypothetical protein